MLMSTVSRARSLPLAGLLLLVAVANAQTADAPREPAVQPANATSLGQAVAPGNLTAAQAAPAHGALRPSRDAGANQSTGGASDAGLAYPPSPLQTAGAIAGALLAILLAIGGVTLTFRSMREERRGRSRRRSARGGAAMTS